MASDISKHTDDSKITNADQCEAILRTAIADYEKLHDKTTREVDASDGEKLQAEYKAYLLKRTGNPDESDVVIDIISQAMLDGCEGDKDIASVVKEAAPKLLAQIAAAKKEPAADVSPETRKPMPREVWQDIFAMRNGQLVKIYSLDKEGRARINAMATVTNRTGQGVNKDLFYSSVYGYTQNQINSWGTFVEFAAIHELDLSGLTLSPHQKQYLFENELQGKCLTSAKLDYANFDELNLSGTKFDNAALAQSSFRKTRGIEINFSGAKVPQADFTEAEYIRPNFTGMQASRSIHFRSVYDMPVFKNTDWNSSRIIASKFFLNDSQGSWDLSSTLSAGCLFYGMGTKPVTPRMTYSKAAFPGSCFYNFIHMADNSYQQKGDFSPLLLDDSRLTAEEKDFFRNFGQWLNSEQAMDGVKVSSDISLDMDDKRIYSLFSEIEFKTGNFNQTAQFFSKGPVIERNNFHEARLVEIADILPEALAKLVQKTDTTVIVAKEPEKGGQKKASSIPEIEFDPADIEQQIEALKKASMADAMGLGNNVQVAFSEASTVVSNWAMGKLSQKSEFTEKIGQLITELESYSIIPPEPVIEIAPEPEPEPLPPPPEKGLGASMMRFFRGPSLEEIEWEVEQQRAQDERWRQEQKRREPIPKDLFEDKLRKELDTLSDAATLALNTNMVGLEDVEKLHNYMGTLKQVIEAYVRGIEEVTPVLIEEKRPIIKIIEMCKHNMNESYQSLDRLDKGVTSFMEAVVDNGIAIHNVQGRILDLNIHFNKAAALHNLNAVLKTNPDSYRKDEKLTGLYTMVVVRPLTEASPQSQVQEAFTSAKSNIIAILRDVHDVMEKAAGERRAALGAILNPT